MPVDDIGTGRRRAAATPDVALAYVTPSHQYPTGRTLRAGAPARNRSRGRGANGCYIVEDDYDCDFRYEGSPLPAVAAMAPGLHDLSRHLLQVARRGIAARLHGGAGAARGRGAHPKTLLNNGNSWLDQAVLAEMMRCGSYAAHLSRIRPQYRSAVTPCLAALHRYFGLVEVSGEVRRPACVLALAGRRARCRDRGALARRVRVGVYALASGGVHDVATPQTCRGAG